VKRIIGGNKRNTKLQIKKEKWRTKNKKYERSTKEGGK
jgi:hypothetical protein